MTAISLENRRSNHRVLRRYDHPWQVNIDDNLITKNIVDLSASGFSFKAPASFDLEPGQVLNLGISLGPEDHFECQGRILWAKSDPSGSRTMKQFGVKFENLPLSIDTRIAQELHKDAIKAHWAKPNLDQDVSRVLPLPLIPVEGNLAVFIRQVITIALIAAFFVATHLYQKSHPEDSIEYRFNQGLAKKISHF